MNLSKSNYQNHLFFISFLAIHYLISIFFVGQIVVEPHDNLDVMPVYDHIISEIYKGNIEKLSYFLSGEIKWYYLEKLFYPINLLHYVLDDKLFYFTNDILKKLFAYFSFFLLAKSLKISKFNSALGAILYSTLVYIKMPVGLGMAFLPYILYLLLNKDKLSRRHYFFLFIIGLNSSLIQDFFSFILLAPLSLLLLKKERGLRIYFQVFSVIIISSILSNAHLIIGSIISEPIHREIWDMRSNSIIFSFVETFKDFFNINLANQLFIFYLPLACLSILFLVPTSFSKKKKIKLLFYFIFTILILKSLLGYNLIDNIFVGMLGVFKGYNFQRIDRIIPIAYSLLFLLYVTSLKNKNLIKFLYFITFFSILSLQLKTPVSIIGQHLLKGNMDIENYNKIKKNFLEKEYTKFFKIIFDTENYKSNKSDIDYPLTKTFDNYYNYKDYSYIKSIIKDSRVMSVGHDPMVAVMNDIKVIDGYHSIYPLKYKIKFREIIENELEKNILLKNYYDNWGNRVYAFYNNKNNIILNFKSAKKLNE